MKRIKLQITKADAQTCKGYCDNGSCLLATAAQRHFKTSVVEALPRTVYINGEGFSISRKAADRIRCSYLFPRDIAQHLRPGFKPFTVTLTKIL